MLAKWIDLAKMPVEKFENGQQRYEFCKALEKAFPDIGKLRKVVSFGLDKNLNAIAYNKNLEDTVFELVHWAETYNKLPKLLESVCNPNYGNPENSLLKEFCEKCSRSQIVDKPPPTPITLPVEDDLSSEKGVDYTRLRDLLKAGNWKEADKETVTVMLKAAGRKSGYLNINSIEKFPCTDLRTIDQLWVKYSNGNFGFSVQQRIWESVDKDYERFGDRVGWRNGEEGTLINKEWLYYNDLTFSLKAPLGHLPGFSCLSLGRTWAGWVFFRVQTCRL